MDLPDSDPRRLECTLRQIEWINRLLTGSRQLLERTILEDLRHHPGRPPYTVLDIAAWLAAASWNYGSSAWTATPG
jgi:hypothetical protein